MATVQCRVQAAPRVARAAVVRPVHLPWVAAMVQADARQMAAASAPAKAAAKVQLAPVRKVTAVTQAAQAAAALARLRATGRADGKLGCRADTNLRGSDGVACNRTTERAL